MNTINQVLEGSVVAREPLSGITDLGEHDRACDRHGQYKSKGMRLERQKREIWAPCPQCEADRVERERAAEADRKVAFRQRELDAMLQGTAIPARFLERSFENFKATTEAQRKALETVRAYAANFDANARQGLGLVLAGPPGTGKSHLAAAILRATLPDRGEYRVDDRGRAEASRSPGRYVTCLGMIRAIRDTWRKDLDKSESQILHELATVSLLVIDEVGVQYGTDGEQTLLFDVLDRRYRAMAPTILLTNQDAMGLKSFVGERVFDRLQENSTWVPFTWGSYRAVARKTFATSGAEAAQ